MCSDVTATITNNVIVGPLSPGFPAIALYNDKNVVMTGNVLLNADAVCEKEMKGGGEERRREGERRRGEENGAL